MITSSKLKELGFEAPPGATVARRIMPATDKPPVTESKPAIRLPAAAVPNKTEARFEQYARALWKPSWMQYEPLTLRLPSGTRYTPDWCCVVIDKFVICEVKGPHIHSAASLRAFKEARAAFPMWSFIFAQWKGGEWLLAGGQ